MRAANMTPGRGVGRTNGALRIRRFENALGGPVKLGLEPGVRLLGYQAFELRIVHVDVGRSNEDC